MHPDFKLNPKQGEQFQLIASPATNILGLGGSRSGKTFGFALATIQRALGIEGSRAGVFRSTIKASRETLFDLTFPDVMRKVYPGLINEVEINKSEATIKFENGSVILFGGLDDDARLEQILGQEFATIYLNEISQISSYTAIGMLKTRLSQQVTNRWGKPASVKMFLDCNPPSNKHWAYKAFVEKVHPESGIPFKRPEDWVSIQMNPVDNLENLQENYLDSLEEGLSSRQQRRFLEGEWQIDIDGALFKQEWVDDYRVDTVPEDVDLVRVIVAVDPSTTSKIGSDETGVMVGALGSDGRGYLLADYSLKGTPEQWAKAVAAAYDDHKADLIVYESNQGGEMVATTLRSSGVNMPVKSVWASRGKVIRAEPISTLYEKGKITHVGKFKELEDQMANFTLDFNRTKQGSPDRLDAMVWLFTELMTVEQIRPATMEVTTAAGIWR